MPPRPHPIVLIALALACFVIAFLVAPRRALPSEGPREARPAAAAARPPARTTRATRPQTAGRAPRRSAGAAAAHPLPLGAPRRSAGAAAAHPLLLGAPRRSARAAARPLPLRAPWRWPLRGLVVGVFRVTPAAPFDRGQRRGIDVAAAPGTAVRAACGGRVRFAGALPHEGLAATVRCGHLVATYLRLGRLDVRRGDHVATGRRLGTLGASGRLRLGARRAGRRRGYVDPLALLRDPRPNAPPALPHDPRPNAPPALGPAPAPRRTRPAPLPPTRPRPRPRPALAPTGPQPLPWPAYPAIALIAAALPVGGLIHRRRRHLTTAATAAREGP